MRSLADKVAVVTGASSGIGRGIAEHLAALGARVVVHGRDDLRTRETAGAIRSHGHDAAAVVADLADVEACRGVVR